MALLSPNTLTPTLQQQKKSVFSSGTTSRRGSSSSVAISFSPQPPQGIGYSPNSSQNTTASPAGSGIPSFRTLRSLLPFGPSKNATLTSISTPPSSSKTSFSGFGSVRRSMTKERERKTSLSNDSTPVISISRLEDGPLLDEPAIRRSASLSRLEKPLPMHPEFDFRSGDDMSASGYVLRTPSPLPTLSAELSTIIEADNSGVSKHLALENASAQSSSSPPIIRRDPLCAESSFDPLHKMQGTSSIQSRGETSAISRSSTFSRSIEIGAHYNRRAELEADSSALELPTDELADQVRQAMRKSGTSTTSGEQWLTTDKAPLIIDGDEHPEVADRSFNVDTVDPDLLALLSPNSGTKNNSSHSLLPREIEQTHSSHSPSTPSTPSSPASRLPRSRQASSFLPRLRSPNPSPTSPQFSITQPSPTSAATTPKAAPLKARPSVSPPNRLSGSPSSPDMPLSATSTPARRMNISRSPRSFEPAASAANLGARTTKVFAGLMRSSDAKTPPSVNGNTNLSTRPIPRTLRQVILGSSDRPHTANARLDPASPPSPTKLTLSMLGRGSLDSRRPSAPNPMMTDIGLGRPSLDIPRGNTIESRTRTQLSRSSTSPERTFNPRDTPTDSSPSPEGPFRGDDAHYRPSFDSGRPSFETSSRPGSAARLRERERERQRTPSLRVTDTSGGRASPAPRGGGDSGPSRARKRSMSVQDRFPSSRGRFASEHDGAAGITRPGSSMEFHGGRGPRGGFGHDGDDGSVSGGPGPKMEWLGPRTAKAFRAAGLLDFERNRDKDKDGDGSDTTERMLRSRDRSGSASGVASSSPLGGGSGAGSLASSQGRLALMRSASEYNPTHGRSHSRLAFSEVGGTTSTSSLRRGSGTFSAYGGASAGGPGGSPYGYAGLTDSPTFTVSSSSRERDSTPKSSTSTAPTSLSESFGFLGRDRADRDRDRDREREEVRELKERHATEMGALLAALSDSQRTARMLREENSQLREKFDRFSGVARENEELRRTCDALESECIGLRGEYVDLQRALTVRSHRSPSGLSPTWSGSSIGGGARTPIAKTGNSSPLSMDATSQFLRRQEEENRAGEEIYDNTILIHDSVDIDNDDNDGDTTPQHDALCKHMDDHDLRIMNAESSSSNAHQRRLSSSSSIFPTVPSNMTMLLHDDSHMAPPGADHSQFHFSFPTSSASASAMHSKATATTPQSKTHSRSLSKSSPITYRNFAGPGHHANKSITSTASISPTTANFSMVTGSPGSLFLRPEHELLLGDMESLDLGVRGTDGEDGPNKMLDDGW